MQVEPPTPDVDPENVEFVIFVRATKVPASTAAAEAAGSHSNGSMGHMMTSWVDNADSCTRRGYWCSCWAGPAYLCYITVTDPSSPCLPPTQYIDEKVKVMMTNSPWVPLTIVKGGQAANFLVKAMESEWGRKLYAKTLIKNIGQAVYKVSWGAIPAWVFTRLWSLQSDDV